MDGPRVALGVLTLVLAACGENDTVEMQTLGEMILESGPMPPVTQGLLGHWGLSDIAVEGEQIALLAMKSQLAFSDNSNPFDPADPTSYSSTTGGLLGGRLALSSDGGRSWRTYGVPADVYRVELVEGRVFYISPLGFDGARNQQLIVREFFPADGSISQPIGEPLYYGRTLDPAIHAPFAATVSALMPNSIGYGYGEFVWNSTDLSGTGATTRIRWERDESQEGIYPAFYPVEGGAAFLGVYNRFVDLIPWQDGGGRVSSREQICTMRLDSRVGPPIHERCDWVVDFPGGQQTYNIVRSWHDSIYYPIAEGSDVYAIATDGLNPARSIYLGAGTVGGQLYRDDFLHVDDRFIWIDENDDVWHFEPPLTNCVAGPGCEISVNQGSRLQAIVPLNGTAAEATDWLAVYELRLDALGKPREEGLWVQRISLSMDRFVDEGPGTFGGEFAGCTDAPYAPTEIDEACARAINCSDGVGRINDCVRKLAAADPATRTAFIAQTDACVPGNGQLGTFPDYSAIPSAQPTAGECLPNEGDRSCAAGRIVNCYETGLGNEVVDCTALGLDCETGIDPTSSPLAPVDAPHCTGNAGCPLDQEPLLRGVCQGDRLFYIALGASRYVDCSALGMRCVPSWRDLDTRDYGFVRHSSYCRGPR